MTISAPSPIRLRALELVGTVVPATIGDASYAEVTQGRDKNLSKYSSCGDLAHWLLWALGARFPWVNRDDPESHRVWRMGRNITLLELGARKIDAWRTPATCDESPGGGDIVVIGPEWHALVLTAPALREDGATWLSADYGQFDREVGKKCSALRTRTFRGGALVDAAGAGRPLYGWIDLDAVAAALPEPPS